MTQNLLSSNSKPKRKMSTKWTALFSKKVEIFFFLFFVSFPSLNEAPSMVKVEMFKMVAKFEKQASSLMSRQCFSHSSEIATIFFFYNQYCHYPLLALPSFIPYLLSLFTVIQSNYISNFESI